MSATPAAARLADELGVDIDEIDGTGTDGKVTVADVRAFDPDDDLTVVDAVKRDLEALGKRDSTLARSGLAASALALARELDSDNSATSKSMCARALIDTLDRLEEMAPEAEEADELDELSRRRAERLRAAAAS